jgi:outer membrane protein assembly factor BamD
MNFGHCYIPPGRARARLGGALLARLLLGTVLLSGLAACGAAATGKVEYSVSAQKNYEKGLERLEAEDWIAAAKYFSFVKARFPYSKYAVLAELRLADAEFGAEHHLQAIDSYKLFIKFHPTHPSVTDGYVSFRIGESYYRMLPGDFWLLPPSYEKDQSAAADAYRELANFVQRFAKSRYRPRAQELLRKVNGQLAAHEWYVATFYWDRDNPMGTVLRLRRLLDRHGGTTYDGDALWLIGQAYVKVGMQSRARQAWQTLLQKHPKHDRADDARRAIGRLRPG